MPKRCRRDRGSAAAELVTITVPAAIILTLFMVLAGRGVTATMDLHTAAAAAARAASLQRDPTTAQTAAQSAVALADTGCTSLTVQVDTTGFGPGGVVSATLTCNVDLSDLAGLAVPGTTTLSVTATSPVDLWRGTTP